MIITEIADFCFFNILFQLTNDLTKVVWKVLFNSVVEHMSSNIRQTLNEKSSLTCLFKVKFTTFRNIRIMALRSVHVMGNVCL